MSQRTYAQQVEDFDWTGTFVNLEDARNLAAEADEEIKQLRAECDGLNDELVEARHEPWPEWTLTILKMTRELSGYDGYDDQDEGVDLVEEVREAYEELTGQNEKQRAALDSAKERIEALEAERKSLIESIEVAAYEWSLFVEVDRAPMTLEKYMAAAIEAALTQNQKEDQA